MNCPALKTGAIQKPQGAHPLSCPHKNLALFILALK